MRRTSRKSRRTSRNRGAKGQVARGVGLYPQQECGLPYDKFRAGWTFKDAHDWIAFRQNEQGQTFRPSQKRIVNQLARMKRSAFEEYEEQCRLYAPPVKVAKSRSDCDRVCSASKPCGRSCVSKTCNCKKIPADPRSCSLDEFQASLPFEQIALDERAEAEAQASAAEDWEDRRALLGSRDESGDTSFDFSMAANRGRAMRRTSRKPRRTSRNPRGRMGAGKEFAVAEAVERVRAEEPREQLGFLPPGLAAKLKRLAPGVYSYGFGKYGESLRPFKTDSLSGAMISTRIAASKSREEHWLVDSRSRYPVIVRAFDKSGKTQYRVEEYAKRMVPAYVTVSRKKHAHA